MSTKLSIAERLQIERDRILRENQERQESESESESESEEEEEYDYDAIEDPEEKKIIMNIESHMYHYKYGGLYVQDVIDLIQYDIKNYEESKYGTNNEIISTENDSNKSSFNIGPVIAIWAGVTLFNYTAKAIIKKIF